MNVISVGLNEFNDALKCLNEKLVKAGNPYRIWQRMTA